MKTILSLVVGVMLAVGGGLRVNAQGTAFTYQGQLTQSGQPANGSFDFDFAAWSLISGGTQQGGTLTVGNVAVSNGLFTVTLDFGDIYTGSALWLDISARPHNNGGFTELSPRQQFTAAPYASYALSTPTASKTEAFSGSLAGDVTGTQSATTDLKVGGQTAATVASGTALARAATSSSAPGTIVLRNGTGSFAAAAITANGFNGNGGGLTNLNASNLKTFTLPFSVIPLSVARLGSNQTFTAVNNFDSQVNVSPGNGTLSITNDAGIVPGIVASGGNAPGHLRFRSSLEIWPNFPPTNSGYLDVRNTNGNAMIVLNGKDGSVTAVAFAGAGTNLTGAAVTSLRAGEITSAGAYSGLTVNTNIYLNDNAVYLRSDPNHGLAYNGNGVTNFPNGTVQPDGPVLWGYTGGALAQMNGGAASALSWNNSGVAISNGLAVGGAVDITGSLSCGNLSITGDVTANNNPGASGIQVPYTTGDFYSVAIGSSNILGYFSCKVPGPGYFVVTATATMYLADYYLQVFDTTTTSYLVDQVFSTGVKTFDQPSTLTFVVPVSGANSTERFELVVAEPILGQQCLCYNNDGTINEYSLTAMFFSRLNN